jgi:primosomal protein N' (replication factor Y)
LRTNITKLSSHAEVDPLTDMEQCCLRVAVPLSLRDTFTYRVPAHLTHTAAVGRRVRVPFRNQTLTGFSLGKGSDDLECGLKEILEILDKEPLFHESLVPFFEWMADYYLYPIGRLIQAALPSGINVKHFKTGHLTEKGLMASELLPSHSEEKKFLTWIKENPYKRLPPPLETAYAFQKKGWIEIESRTNEGQAGPLKRKFVRVKKVKDPDTILKEQAGTTGTKNELIFLKTLFDAGDIPLKSLSSTFDNGAYLVKKWIKKGVLESYLATVSRNPSGKIMFPPTPPPELTEQQKTALMKIQNRLEKGGFSTCLLHGVTGSGKTEVYQRAIEYTNRLGRQAILMVPEIALVDYMEGIFRYRLGDRMAVFHSGLSQGERFDQWMRMVRGEVDLVIGARSALFSPLPRLGLIIVDEEHDTSYKQEEGSRHQARDAAVVRGKIEKALVILGSGTPSIQSFQNALAGRYKLLSMPDRIESRPLPEMQIVDMKGVPDKNKKNGMISPHLKEALDRNLTEGKQAILFLNRRGFHRVYLCRFCGQSVRCANCDMALIHHLNKNLLACHYCGFHIPPHNTCPSCGRQGMRAYGFGTERVEQELKALYPERCVARMDRDSTRRKGHAFKILKKFSRHEIDILVGTQMITKGYDFPHVTLVGVIAADLSLGFPDFRAGERTFQLLSQVAGRAGRGEQRGTVIVQTFNPEHYAITAAERHDFEAFFQKEKALREQLGYPPFSYLVCLRLQGNNSKVATAMAARMGREISGILKKWPKRGKEIQVLGPAEAPLSKLKGKYRWQILIKCGRAVLLHYLLEEVQRVSKKILRSSGVSMIVDVDPYQML